MTFESAALRPIPTTALRRPWWSSLIVLLGILGSAARAQTTAPAIANNTEVMAVIARLDAKTIGLIVAAVAILALLIWRVASMVRRERPVAPPTRARRAGKPDDEDTIGGRTSMQQPTDWGFDQNKRAALARSPVAMPKANADLPSLDQAVTMWTMSDVHNANRAGFQPDDSLGKSPNQAPSPYRTSFNPYFRGEQAPQRLEVVEVADTLLQAELLVQLGDPKQAMTLLSHHIRDTEKPGPAAWLMLLNLYQSTGRESQYNALSTGFKTLFNAEVPPWASTPDAAARDLETYLQVMLKLQTTWATGDARSALEGLLNDDRGGSRQGFSLAAYRELLFLAEILDALDAIATEEEEKQGIRRKLNMPA